MEREEEKICSFPLMLLTGPALVSHMAMNGHVACRHTELLTMRVPWGCSLELWPHECHALFSPRVLKFWCELASQVE